MHLIHRVSPHPPLGGEMAPESPGGVNTAAPRFIWGVGGLGMDAPPVILTACWGSGGWAGAEAGLSHAWGVEIKGARPRGCGEGAATPGECNGGGGEKSPSLLLVSRLAQL